MRVHSWLAVVAIAASGCAGIQAPRGSVPMVAVAPQDPFGGWAAVWEGKGYSPDFQGELIAVGPDSVFVLAGDSLVARSIRSVRRVRVVGYDPKAADLMTWTFLGTVSTASHGIVAVLSAPLWLLIGSTITSGAAHASEINVPSQHRTWEDLRPYARFPEGLPPGIDRSSLRPRMAVVGGNGR
jgi:hypothetical protein